MAKAGTFERPEGYMPLILSVSAASPKRSEAACEKPTDFRQPTEKAKEPVENKAFQLALLN